MRVSRCTLCSLTFFFTANFPTCPPYPRTPKTPSQRWFQRPLRLSPPSSPSRIQILPTIPTRPAPDPRTHPPTHRRHLRRATQHRRARESEGRIQPMATIQHQAAAALSGDTAATTKRSPRRWTRRWRGAWRPSSRTADEGSVSCRPAATGVGADLLAVEPDSTAATALVTMVGATTALSRRRRGAGTGGGLGDSVLLRLDDRNRAKYVLGCSVRK